MAFPIIATMLCAASMSAGWNAVVKNAENKLYMTILMAGGSGLVGALVLPFLRQPAVASWPFIAASAACSVVYYAVVAKAYHAADLSQTYPLMRGTAPLLVALTSRWALGERLSLGAWLGVGLISLGIFFLAASTVRKNAAGVALAMGNAVVITCYTLIDGLGVRRSGTPAAYCLWVYTMTAVPLVAWGLVTRRAEFSRYVAERPILGLLGGSVGIGIYATSLWAMTVAPVAIVAALRETSILFAILISSVVLKERVGYRRLAMVCAIAGGAVVLRLA
jgi:drug/metabolite transporter (DMT)-like permease